MRWILITAERVAGARDWLALSASDVGHPGNSGRNAFGKENVRRDIGSGSAGQMFELRWEIGVKTEFSRLNRFGHNPYTGFRRWIYGTST